MQQDKPEVIDLKAYRIVGKLTILQFMAVLAIIGIGVTVASHLFI